MIKEEEKPKFVEGMIVEVWYNAETLKKYKEISRDKIITGNMKPIDWKTLARTIAYFIPDADRGILNEYGLRIIDKDGVVITSIPYPNPINKRQEIDIERG